MDIPSQTQSPPLLIEQNFPTIALWLRDVYGRIQVEPITYSIGVIEGEKNIDTTTKASLLKISNFNNKDPISVEALSTTSFFLSGGDIFLYLSKHPNQNLCNQTITIVINGLRDFYWNNRTMLSKKGKLFLEMAMAQPSPTFENVFDYKIINNYKDRFPLPIFQLSGIITPFDVIYIPVRYFVDCINNNQPIRIELANTSTLVEFGYEPYDFWDFETQRLINILNC